MQHLPSGIRSDPEEATYQEWIKANPGGIILNKAGRTYTLHGASCPTMSYDLQAKSQIHP